MKKAILFLVMTEAMFLPYLFFDFVTANTVPFLTMGVATVLIFLLPTIVLSGHGLRFGLVSGILFNATLTMCAVNFPLNIATASYVLMGWIANPLSLGLATWKINDKRSFVPYFLVAIGVQVVIRIIATVPLPI